MQLELRYSCQNNIPVFCPALTDGSIGDMIYFHSFRSPGLVLDIVGDIRALNELARKSKKAGMIVLGGGVCKHQIANAMLIVRNRISKAVLAHRLFCTAQWRRLFGIHRKLKIGRGISLY